MARSPSYNPEGNSSDDRSVSIPPKVQLSWNLVKSNYYLILTRYLPHKIITRYLPDNKYQIFANPNLIRGNYYLQRGTTGQAWRPPYGCRVGAILVGDLFTYISLYLTGANFQKPQIKLYCGPKTGLWWTQSKCIAGMALSAGIHQSCDLPALK